MSNKSLTYKKDAKKTFVEGYFNNKFSSTPKNVSASEAFVYDVANEQREFFQPIFANETKYLSLDKWSSFCVSCPDVIVKWV